MTGTPSGTVTGTGTATRCGTRSGYAALVAAAAAWGSSVVLIDVAVRGLSILALTLGELVVAALALGALLSWRHRAGGAAWPRLTVRIAVAGALEPGISYVCINTGIANTSGTHAALLLGTESVFVVLLAAAVGRRLPALLMIVGLLLAVSGSGLLADSGGHGASWHGDLLVVAGALAAAVYVVVVQPVSGAIDAIDLTGYQFLTGTVLATPLAWLAAGHATLGSDPQPRYWVCAGLVGLVGSVVAFALYNWALQRTSAGAAGGSLTLIPVFGTVFSILFLGDSLGLRTVLAAVGVLSGLLLMSISENRPG